MRSGVGRVDLGVAAPRVRGPVPQVDACLGKSSEPAVRPGEADGWGSPVDSLPWAEGDTVGRRLRCSTGRPVGQLAMAPGET